MSAARWIAAITVAALRLTAGQRIDEDSARLEILQTVFPGMQIVAENRAPVPKQRRQDLLDFPDAMAGQIVYRVTGAASGSAENCASEDAATLRHSQVRKVQIVAYRWPKQPGVLAVLQYQFPDISPAGACWSVARMVRISEEVPRRVLETREIAVQHHSDFSRIELKDLNGDGVDELLVEFDWGGAGTTGSSLQILDLEQGHFEPWIEIPTRQAGGIGEIFTQVLDLRRTRASRASQLCFTRTGLGADGELYRVPRISKPCYSRGTELGLR